MWITSDFECQSNGEINYDGSLRNDPKRSHQYLTEITGSELCSNKKQAIESVENRPGMGISLINMPPWQDSPNYNSASGQFSEGLFEPDHVHNLSLAARNFSSVAIPHNDVGRRIFEGSYDNLSTIGLSLSRAVDDTSPSLSFGGIRKVKVNQAQDSNKGTLEHVRDPYLEEELRSLNVNTACSRSESDTIIPGQVGRNNDKSWFPTDPDYNMAVGTFMSMRRNFIKDGDLIAMTPCYNRVQENFIPSYSKAAENFVLVGPHAHKGVDNMLPMGPSSSKADCMSFMVSDQDKRCLSRASVNLNVDNSESNTISFGGFHDEAGLLPSGSIINSYDSIGNMIEPSRYVKVNNSSNANSKSDTPKMKDSKAVKKVTPNNFPSNVKSLLSTGMFDGVPVKYYSWSREKNLKGVIKGTGYLCSCQNCNLSKVLNAYEFEQHAHCKTKHPNNHIYFDNGKTVYAVVQELKSTPQEMLFDAIQNATGSQINQKNFSIWKASYQAATLELQRIYGKDAVILPG